MSLKPDTIRAIFTNILFVIGVVLLIVGFSRGTLTVANIITFDKYPLASYEESRCDYELSPKPVVETSPTNTNVEELQKQKEKCLAGIDQQRKQKQVDDIVSSVSLLVSGGALVIFFRRFITKG